MFLLHEMGHVEHRHIIRIAAHSIATSVFIAFIFTDMEGLTDLILGTATSLTDQAFSREMEADADTFAINALKSNQESPVHLAEALAALRDSHGKGKSSDDVDQSTSEDSDSEETKKKVKKLLKYLSTHPAIEERIQHARDAAQK